MTPESFETLLDFGDPTVAEIKVPPINGNNYILREPTGEAIIKWRTTQFRGAQISKDGSSASLGSGMFESESLLVSMCLCKTESDGSVAVNKAGEAILVPHSEVKKFPNRILKPLYKWCIQVSKADEVEETEDKIVERMAKDQKRLDELRNGKSDAKN